MSPSLSVYPFSVSRLPPHCPALKLLDIDGEGFLSVMDEKGATRDDVRLPDNEVGAEIRTKFDK